MVAGGLCGAAAVCGQRARDARYRPAPARPCKKRPDTVLHERHADKYSAVVDPQGKTDVIIISLKSGMEKAYFSRRKAKPDKRMKAALVPTADAHCKHDGNNPPRPFGLTLGPDSVAFTAQSATNTEEI